MGQVPELKWIGLDFPRKTTQLFYTKHILYYTDVHWQCRFYFTYSRSVISHPPWLLF